MTQANMEIVRRSLEAFSDRRFDLSFEGWDAEAEWRPAMAGEIEGRVYRGATGLRRYVGDLSESFSDVRISDPDFRDLGDRVLVLPPLARARTGAQGCRL